MQSNITSWFCPGSSTKITDLQTDVTSSSLDLDYQDENLAIKYIAQNRVVSKEDILQEYQNLMTKTIAEHAGGHRNRFLILLGVGLLAIYISIIIKTNLNART